MEQILEKLNNEVNDLTRPAEVTYKLPPLLILNLGELRYAETVLL